MTTLTIRSRKEFSLPTTNSDVANAKRVLTSESTTDGNLMTVMFVTVAEPEAKLPGGFVRISDHVASVEADPEQRRYISEARKTFSKLLDDPSRPTIRTLRLNKGLSQAQVAQLIETSQPQIARLEAGKHDPTYDTFVKLARALSVEITDIVTAFGNARNRRRDIAE